MSNITNCSRRDFIGGAGAVAGGVAAMAAGANLGMASAEEATQETGLKPLPLIMQCEPYTDGEIVDIDLLIIGSGYAGLWATLTAAANGVTNIALVDKGAIGHSSAASMTLGTSGFALPDEGDNIDAIIKELVEGSDYLSRQDIWVDLINSTQSRLEMLNSWGMQFTFPVRLSSDGNVEWKLSLGADYIDSTGNHRVAGKANLGAALDQVAKIEGIKYYSKTMITDLLKEGDKVAGAVGFSRKDGRSIAFRAKATIVATGQCTFRGQHAMGEVETGDGFKMVYDAGGTLGNMEFLSFDVDPEGYMLEGGSILVQKEMGCEFLNAEGDAAPWWNMDPVNGPGGNVSLSTRAMALEVMEGRGPIICNRNTEAFGYPVWEAGWKPCLPLGSWQRTNEDRFAEIGYDLIAQPQVFTANSFGIIGAVDTTIDCTTEVPGMFVASIAVLTDPGKVKGVESQRAYWSGQRAAASACAYLAQAETPAISDDEIAAQLAAIVAPLGKEGSLTSNQLLNKLQSQIFKYDVSILKTEEKLQQALAVCRECQAQLGDVAIEDAHELTKWYETRNMVDMAELYLLASIERKESRVCHYRLDYPQRDDANWLKWIEFKKGADGAPEMFYKEVPFAEYPVQPDPERGLNAPSISALA